MLNKYARSFVVFWFSSSFLIWIWVPSKGYSALSLMPIYSILYTHTWKPSVRRSGICEIMQVQIKIKSCLNRSGSSFCALICCSWWDSWGGGECGIKQKKWQVFVIPSYHISLTVCRMHCTGENWENVFLSLYFFLYGAPPVEESETAAKQKWQQQFGIRVSSRTLGKRERKRGKDECVPVGRGQLVERQPWVQSGGLISLSFVTHLLLGLINPPAQKEVAAVLAQLAGVWRLILKKLTSWQDLVLSCTVH